MAAQALFWIYTYPANQATGNWTQLPTEWMTLRAEWEYSHAAGAVLTLTAFVFLVLSVLLDEPFQGLAPVLAQQYSTSLRRLQEARPELCIVVTESNRSLLKDMPTETLVLERGELQRGEAAAAAVH